MTISHHFWLSHDSHAVVVPCYTRSHNFLTHCLTHSQTLLPPFCSLFSEMTTAKTTYVKERSVAVWLTNHPLQQQGRDARELLKNKL